jgi:hypothetical protein
MGRCFWYLRLTRWRSWESSARVTAHISAPLNLEMWPGCQGIDARWFRDPPGFATAGCHDAEVVVVGRTGGPKNKVLRAIVTRMRRAFRQILILSERHVFNKKKRASPFTSLHKSHFFTFLHVSRFFTLSQFFTAVWGGWGNRSAGFEEMFDSILTPLYQHTGYTGYTGWISTVLCWGPTGPFEERHAECLRHQLWRTGSHLMAAIAAIALSWLSWKSFENKY